MIFHHLCPTCVFLDVHRRCIFFTGHIDHIIHYNMYLICFTLSEYVFCSHIADVSLSFSVRSCFKIMAPHRIQQNRPPPPAESSDLRQPKCNISHLGASSQTTNSGKSGIKRSLEDEDGKACGTSQPSKRVKSTHDDRTLPKSCALQSALSSNSQTQSCISPSVKRKRTNEEEPGHKEKRSRNTSSEQRGRVKPTKKIHIEDPCTQPRVKRKAPDDDDDKDVRPAKMPSPCG